MLVDIHTARKHMRQRERERSRPRKREVRQREKSIAGSSCLWLITVSN